MEFLAQLHRLIAVLRSRTEPTERGASLVEYAFLVGLIAVVCIVAITFFGGGVSNLFTFVSNSVAGA